MSPMPSNIWYSTPVPLLVRVTVKLSLASRTLVPFFRMDTVTFPVLTG